MSNQSTPNQANKQLVWDYWEKLDSVADAELEELLESYSLASCEWFGYEPLGHMPSRVDYLRSYLHPLRASFGDLERHTHIFMGGPSDGKADGSTVGKAVGIELWYSEGKSVGEEEGTVLGDTEGLVEGIPVGSKLPVTEGPSDGNPEGCADGLIDGLLVGTVLW